METAQLKHRDVNTALRLIMLRAARSVRRELGADAVTWFNHCAGAANATARVTLGTLAVLFTAAAQVCRSLREKF